MSKLRLNVDELNEDFFEDTRLLGITAYDSGFKVFVVDES